MENNPPPLPDCLFLSIYLIMSHLHDQVNRYILILDKDNAVFK